MSDGTNRTTAEDIAKQIASGHAFDYHVLGEPRTKPDGSLEANSNQFNHETEKYGNRLGITDRDLFEQHLVETLKNPETIGYRRSNGGAVFFNQQNNTFVLYNPADPHGGTALRSEYGVEGLTKFYDQDVRRTIAAPLAGAALQKGGFDNIMAIDPPTNLSADNLEQSVGDRRTAARERLQELGLTTYTSEGIALRKPLQAAEHHAARGVGVASLAVHTTEGNYGAAGIDAAAIAADNRTVQEAAVKVAETAAVKAGLAETLEGAAKGLAQVGKRIPLAGAVITAGFVAHEVGGHLLDGEYKVAGAAAVAGGAEALGNVVGLGVGDGMRELARTDIILAGGDKYAAVQKSGLRELGEGAVAVVKSQIAEPAKPVTGAPLSSVLPDTYRSMTLGSDEMGERSEVSRVAIERTGFAANDPRNDLATINQQPGGVRAHMLVQGDGSVQGPDVGGVAFGNNPSLAAGKNGGTLGVLYAGTGAMNDAQYNTVTQITGWLGAQRQSEGLSGPVEQVAGSLATSQLTNLPTPQGFTAGAPTQDTSTSPSFMQVRRSNGTNGP